MIELFFAFGVALVCILFSWNLMRSIRHANDDFHSMPQGDFPRMLTASSLEGGRASLLSEPLTGTYNTFYRGRKNPFSNSDLSELEGGGDEDREKEPDAAPPPPPSSLFSAFFNYVRM